MKNIIILTILLFLAFHISAQTSAENKEKKDDINEIEKWAVNK